jgi:hypothetical protein
VKAAHPSLLHTQADFDRMAAKVAAKASPWIDSWNILTGPSNNPNTFISLNRTPNAQVVVYRGSDGVHAQNYMSLAYDVAAAYACAVYWKVTGDTAYANKAVDFMNAWSSTLTAIGGSIDGFLASGLQGYQFANAAEIMRGYSGWAAADFTRFQTMMINIFYKDNHQGLQGSLVPLTVYSNWQLCCMASMLAIGVLCDNQSYVDEAVNYFKSGSGNGCIYQTVNYLHAGYLGQTQESGRDQGHNTLSVMLLTTICEMAWNQGIDLYGFDNNRVLSAAEYVSRGNLNDPATGAPYTMPFAPYAVSGIYDNAFAGSGARRAGWALIYHHYVNRRGLAAPYTKQYMLATQPEGGGGAYGPNSGGFDQLGYTTLTCTRDPIAVGADPSALTAYVSGGNVVLSWWGSAHATSYNVKRSAKAGGPYTQIASITTDLLTYTDTSATAGKYYYVVSAVTPTETAPSNEVMADTTVFLHTHLAFDEGSGTTAADASGNAHTGTLVNAAWTAVSAGYAVALSGSNAYVNLPSGLLDGFTDCTIAAWVRWSGGGWQQRIFDFGSGTDKYIYLSPSGTNGVLHFGISICGPVGEQTIVDTAALPANTWTHVAVTLSGTTGTLYVNHNAVATNTAMLDSQLRSINTSRSWLGRSQFPADPYFNGFIDEFRIYKGVLTQAQIAAL